MILNGNPLGDSNPYERVRVRARVRDRVSWLVDIQKEGQSPISFNCVESNCVESN